MIKFLVTILNISFVSIVCGAVVFVLGYLGSAFVYFSWEINFLILRLMSVAVAIVAFVLYGVILANQEDDPYNEN